MGRIAENSSRDPDNPVFLFSLKALPLSRFFENVFSDIFSSFGLALNTGKAIVNKKASTR